MRLQTIHLLAGVVALLAFLLTGQYMQWVHHSLAAMPDGPRLFFRSAHIYLLWSSLLNLLLGCYLVRLGSGLARHVQLAASMCILAGPIMLVISFFFEQHNAALARPVGQWAVFAALGGVLAHAAAVAYARGMTLSGAKTINSEGDAV